MTTPQMSLENFPIGTIVDVQSRTDLKVYGTVKSLSDQEAVVLFKIPRETSVCMKCYSYAMLSRDCCSGEIVCMRSGCGHGHGFDEHTEPLPLSDLVNMTAMSNEDHARYQEKRLATNRLIKALNQGLKKGAWDQDFTDQTLKRLRSL